MKEKCLASETLWSARTGLMDNVKITAKKTVIFPCIKPSDFDYKSLSIQQCFLNCTGYTAFCVRIQNHI
jgi:hypothetical protein